MRATRDTMLLAPPFIVSRDEVDFIIETARSVLDRTAVELKERGFA